MILITGATGFVGTHLMLHLLETEQKVRAIYRNEAKIKQTKYLFLAQQKQHLFDNIEWLFADITNIPTLEKAFENIDFVYHCAGMISFDHKDEHQLRKVNIEGTANIVNFCLHKKVKKLIHVSSIATLGSMTNNEKKINEEAIWNPEMKHSDYAISKYGAEIEIWRGQQEGLKVAVVNPGVIFGNWCANAEDKSHSMTIFRKIQKGLKFYTNGSTGFVGVGDVVKIMAMLMQTNNHGERYILVAENLKFQDVFVKIAHHLKVKPPTIKIKKRVANKLLFCYSLLSKIFFKKQLITKMIAQTLYEKNSYDNLKIKKTLKFEFETIASCIKKIDYY